jgi:hypothetical protein
MITPAIFAKTMFAYCLPIFASHCNVRRFPHCKPRVAPAWYFRINPTQLTYSRRTGRLTYHISRLPPSRAATYFTISDAYATAVFTRCNLASDVSSLAVFGSAIADFDTCTGGPRVNLTSCAANQTATMVAAHDRVAAVRAACNSCAYPLAPASSRPEAGKARFAVAAEAAYNAAADIFVALAFVSCNKAALDMSVAASADAGEDMLAAYPGICSVRTACIASGNARAPASPAAHPGELPRVMFGRNGGI